jgi:hypothetical protein
VARHSQEDHRDGGLPARFAPADGAGEGGRGPRRQQAQPVQLTVAVRDLLQDPGRHEDRQEGHRQDHERGGGSHNRVLGSAEAAGESAVRPVDVRAEDARFRHEHLRSGEGVLAQRREERRHHAVRAVGERRRAAVEAAERVDQEESAAAPGVPRHFDAVPQVLHRGPQDVLVPEVVEVHVGREDCGELRHRLRQVQTVPGFEQRQAHPAVLLQFGRLLQRDDHPSEQTLRGVDQDQDAGVERRPREALRQRQIGRVYFFELRKGRHQRLRVRHSQRAGPAQQELSHFGDGRQQERRLVDKADVEGRRLVLGRARPEQYQSGGDDQQFAVEARRRRRTIPEGVERDQKRQQRLQGTARVALQLPHDHSPRKHEENTERGGHGAADDRRPRQLDRRAGNDHSGDDNATGEDFVVSVHANGHECELLRVKKKLRLHCSVAAVVRVDFGTCGDHQGQVPDAGPDPDRRSQRW